MVPREFKEDKVHREPKVFKAYKDRLALVLRAFKDLQAYKVLPDLMDPKASKEFRVLLAPEELMDLKVLLDHKESKEYKASKEP